MGTAIDQFLFSCFDEFIQDPCPQLFEGLGILASAGLTVQDICSYHELAGAGDQDLVCISKVIEVEGLFLYRHSQGIAGLDQVGPADAGKDQLVQGCGPKGAVLKDVHIAVGAFCDSPTGSVKDSLSCPCPLGLF